MINNLIESITTEQEVPCQDCYKMRYDLLLLEHKELRERFLAVCQVMDVIKSTLNN